MATADALSVGLVVLLAAVAPALASVTLKTGNYSFDPLPDMPADFGPPIPDGGVSGLLVVANPEDACERLETPVTEQAWIALIARSQRVQTNCTFDVKVRNAEQAGAAAAIVYDDVYESLIIMSMPRDHLEPNIPSVFVAQKSGVVMKRLMTEGGTTATITRAMDTWWLSMLLAAFAGCLAVSVISATLYYIRRQRWAGGGRGGYSLLGGGPEGMTAAQMRALPVIIYDSSRRHADPVVEGDTGSSSGASDSEGSSHLGAKGGGTLHVCAVCIEDYRDGDKLRVLPCQHRFHKECIDQWLSSRKPLCPVCKHDALQPLPPSELGGPSAEAGSATDSQPAASAGRPPRRGPRRWRWRWHHLPPMQPARDVESQVAVLPDASHLPADSMRLPPVRLAPPGSPPAGHTTPQVPATPQNFPGLHSSRSSGAQSSGILPNTILSEITVASDCEGSHGATTLSSGLHYVHPGLGKDSLLLSLLQAFSLLMRRCATVMCTVSYNASQTT